MARIVGYDAGSPELNKPAKRIVMGSLPIAGSERQNAFAPRTHSLSINMNILLTNHQLGLLLRDAADMGAKLVLAKTGRLKPYLNKSEAFRLYGRKNIENWIEKGLITSRKDGNHSATWRIDRTEVEAVRKSLDAMRYL